MECSFYEGSPCGGGAECFLPGTQISTPEGKVDIETLKEGDKVSSFDDKTGTVAESNVSSIYSRQVADYYIVKTKSGKEIKVTGEHPLYTGDEIQPAKTLGQQIANSFFLGKMYLQLGWEWAWGRGR